MPDTIPHAGMILQYGRGVQCGLCHGEHEYPAGAKACFDAFMDRQPKGKPPTNEDR
jgi:hypothetical protein